MMDFRQPDPSPSNPSDPGEEQENLILWLLGELSPEEAEKVAVAWRHRSGEVERWRRFLANTERIGRNVRAQAFRDQTESRQRPMPESGVMPRSRGPVRPASRPPLAAVGGKGPLASLRAIVSFQVPKRVVPLAILAPIVIVFLLWLTRVSFAPSGGPFAVVSVLSPMVQVLDQGVAQPSGPVGVGAKIRLRGDAAAAQFRWNGDQCQAVVSGNAVLLVAEADFGLIQQEGRLTYDVVAHQRPLQIWTSQGTLEIAEASVVLTGTSTFLRYEVLDGSIRLPSNGEMLLAGASGEWGRPSPLDGFAGDMVALHSAPGTGGIGDKGETARGEDDSSPGDSLATAAFDAFSTHAAVLAALAARPAPPAPPPRVSGRVIRSDFSPVEGARLSLHLSGGETRETRWRDTLTTVTASDGRFVFRGVRDAASVWLRVEHPRLVAEQPSREIALDSAEEQFVLFAPSSIAGRLLTSDGAAYAGDARIDMLRSIRREGEAVALRPLRSPDDQRVASQIEDGSYLVSGLAPGAYKLRVETSDGQTGESSDIEVGLEEWLTGVDIALIPGGRFSGRVVDGASLFGIDGARVELLAPAPRGGERGRDDRRSRGNEADASQRSKGSVECDESGNFSIHGILPGSYEVRAVADDYEEARLSIRIEVGKTREEVIPLFGEAAVVFGRVVDHTGLPIAEARVSAEQSPERLYDEKRATTEADGRYELRLPPGRWTLRTQAPQDRASWARETVEIERPTRIERNFVLFSGVRVHGTVTRSGRPVQKTRLFFAQAGSRHGAGSAHTDESGRYETVLRAGRYSLFVAGQQRAQLDLHGIAEYRQDVVIADNLVSGVISDAETGEAIVGARVILEGLVDGAPPADTAALMDFFRRSRFARSDAMGYYEFSDVEPGTYRLRAVAEAYAENTVAPVVVSENDDNFLTVPVALDLATALLEVHFTDAKTGRPLSGAAAWRVASLETGEEMIVDARPRLSDDTGFYLITNLAPGAYSFTFIRALNGGLYLPVTMSGVRVSMQETAKLDVAFQQGGAIRTTVRRAGAHDPSILVPVSNATVRLTPPAGVSSHDLRLDRTVNTEGHATFSPLPPGFYSVEVSAPGMVAQVRNANVAAGETAGMEIELAPASARVD